MKNKSFYKEILLFSVVGLFINIFCVFLFFIPSKAMSITDGSLPYKKSQVMTYNSFMNNDIIDNLRLSNLPIDDDNYVLMYSDHSPYTQWPQYNNQYDVTYYFFLLPIDSFNSVSEGYNFYNNSLGLTLTSGSYYYYIEVTCDLTSTFDLIAIRPVSYTSYSVSLYNSGMFGHIPSIDSVSNFSFTPMTPVYFNQDFYSLNDVLVLDYTENTPIVVPEYTGHAVPPDSFEEPIFPTGHAKPSQVPQLTINNYTWNTPPTPDFSTLEDTAVSIYNYLSWLGSNLLGAFGNLFNNIGNVADYLGKTLQYYLGLILSAIINGITNFYNNLVALIEPFLNYYTEPIDTQAVHETVEDTSIYGLITVGWNFHNTYKDFFDSITQVNSLTFTIPYTIWTQSGYIIVDFSWYDDIRNLILPWIVGFLYAGFGLYIFRSIPSIIHGLSGVMQKGA